jgi:hypothetical protein
MLKTISSLSSILLLSLITVTGLFSTAYAKQNPLHANPDQLSISQSGNIAIDVLQNDTGKGLKITAASAFSQQGANVVINLSRSKIIYTPAANFTATDSFWYEVTDSNGQKQATYVRINRNGNTAARNASLDFLMVPMHYVALNNEPHTFGENEGLVSFTLAQDANVGERTITLSGNTNLHDSELVVYLSKDGNYIVTQVLSRNGNTITLTEPLNEAIAKGNHLWNFYHDTDHPNQMGFRALADFALGKVDTSNMANKVHAFIGDSWLDDGTIEQRIKQKIDNITTINKAVGGRTSAEELAIFDEDFPPGSAAPDFFWVILGTNDFFQNVTPENYISNIKQIIQKINALGATAIVFDSSVGDIFFDDVNNVTSSIRKDLSDAYANKLAELAANNGSGGSSSGGSSSGGSSSGGSSSGGSSSGGSSSGGSSAGGSGSGGSGSGGLPTVVPSQGGGGGSIFFLELLLLGGLIARKYKG